jgi:hypothetical protein
MTLELLLAHADSAGPVLQPGLGAEVLSELPPIEPLALPRHLWDESGEMNHLPSQRWGLVVPKGHEGDRLLEAISRLRAVREAQQGGKPCHVYRAPVGMDGPTASRWKRYEVWDTIESEEERPRYLLVLGDLDQVSLATQQQFATDTCIGRLAFPRIEDYDTYARKVLRWEEASALAAQARMLFYTSEDGTDAVILGRRKLIEPCLAACGNALGNGAAEGGPLDIIGRKEDPLRQLMAQAAMAEPALLLSLSHGLGRPKGGWGSAAHQRELQGALKLPDGRHLSAADLRTGSFLPGGIWFMFACFSAGMPSESLYTDWMQRIPQLEPRVAGVLDMMPRAGEAPFTSALPQAVLANPEGPLAVMGHVDLAWTSSFSEEGRDRSSRFSSVLKALLKGRRAGAAMRHLMTSFNDANMALTTLEAQVVKTRRGRNVASMPPVTAARANVWMLRQDLSGFVLLGDPAVRLPLAPRTER